MRHLLEPEYRKHVKGYGFLSFARSFGNKYGKSIINSKNVKKLMDVATKTSKAFAKIAGKKIILKSPEETGDLVSVIKLLTKLLQWVKQEVKNKKMKRT